MNTIILVCGFGRCGTSLAMQMLDKGGVPATGAYPTFETACPGHLTRQQWAATLHGRAVKVLDPHVPGNLPPVSSDHRFRAIWLDRDHGEQAKSQMKFLGAFGPQGMALADGRTARRALMSSYRAQRPLALATLTRVCKGPPLVLSFEQLITDTLASAAAMAGHLRLPLNLEAMASVVLPRRIGCYNGFLELDLMGGSR